MIYFVFKKEPGSCYFPEDETLVFSVDDLLEYGKDVFVRNIKNVVVNGRLLPICEAELIADTIDIFFNLYESQTANSYQRLNKDMFTATAQAMTLKQKVSIYKEKDTDNYYIRCYYDCFIGKLSLNHHGHLRTVFISTVQGNVRLVQCFLPRYIAIPKNPLVHEVDLIPFYKEQQDGYNLQP